MHIIIWAAECPRANPELASLWEIQFTFYFGENPHSVGARDLFCLRLVSGIRLAPSSVCLYSEKE